MRVISGRFGGRRLVAPSGSSTRPTSDRVKEAIFSILGDLEGARVVDLCAGTGALGIEALSRGATAAQFIENDARALEALRKNLASLGLEDLAVVIPLPGKRAATKVGGPVSLVFVDPPYREAEAFLDILGAWTATILTADARISFEHHRKTVLAHPKLETYDTRFYGDTAVSFLRASSVDSTNI